MQVNVTLVDFFGGWFFVTSSKLYLLVLAHSFFFFLCYFLRNIDEEWEGIKGSLGQVHVL